MSKGSILVVMDDISGIAFHKDTSFSILLEGQRRGFDMYLCQIHDLFVLQGQPRVLAKAVRLRYDSESWYEIDAHAAPTSLQDFACVFMRTDPPFTIDYINATYCLSLAQDHGVVVSNDPQALRDRNEKFALCHVPEFAPEFLVSADATLLTEFIEGFDRAVVKPLDAMGGRDIFDLTKGAFNTKPVLEHLTKHGSRLVMAQRFLPEIKTGDKRVFVVAGEVYPVVVTRVPDPEVGRGNLDQGASVDLKPLTERDLAIATSVASQSFYADCQLIGLDIIGDFLTEINITSVTGIRFFDEAEGRNPIAEKLYDSLALS